MTNTEVDCAGSRKELLHEYHSPCVLLKVMEMCKKCCAGDGLRLILERELDEITSCIFMCTRKYFSYTLETI